LTIDPKELTIDKVKGEFRAASEFCFASEFTVMKKLTIDPKELTIDKVKGELFPVLVLVGCH
jgi:hypothetical protein